MRIRHWILVGSASLLVGGFAASGCGGTSSDNAPPTDAGHDVADQTAPPKDTGPDTVDTGPGVCVPDADLTKLNPPDASLADGATSVGICVGCIEGSCSGALKACNDDCACNSAVQDAITCFATGKALASCAGPLTTLPKDSAQLGQNLGICIIAACRQQCAPNINFDGGGDGAPADAADGG